MKKAILTLIFIFILTSTSVSGLFVSDYALGQNDIDSDPPAIDSESPPVEGVQLNETFDELGLSHYNGIGDEALANGWTVVLFFHVDWCFFCQEMKTVVDDVEEAFSDRAVFLRVDAANNSDVVDAYKVSVFPALVVVSPGKKENTVINGYKEPAELIAELNDAMGEPAHTSFGESETGLEPSDSLSSLLDEIAFLEEAGFDGSLGGVVDRVLSLDHFVFLFFQADWCFFCGLEKPIVDELEAAYVDEVVFIRVDEERNPWALNEFSVDGFPTMFLITGKNVAGYERLVIEGFNDKPQLIQELNNAIGRAILTVGAEEGGVENVGGFFTHHSCDFVDCVDGCTDEKEINWDSIINEFSETIAGCFGPLAVNIPYACGKARITNDINDIIGCLSTLLDLTGKPISCSYAAGHLLADILGAQQLGECLGECAEDSGSYGGLCDQGEKREKCVGSGFKGVEECDDCEWQRVPGTVTSCPPGQDCVMGANGAECRERDEDDDDPNHPPKRPPKKPGNDHPDDNNGVVSIFEDDTTYDIYSNFGREHVAVLDRGFTESWRSILNRWGYLPEMIEVDYLSRISHLQYPVLIIPTGGFYGIGSAQTQENLERYVEEGGILISFTQQYGEDFQLLPGGEVDGFGFHEDMSCFTKSSLITTYSPMIAFTGDLYEEDVLIGEYRYFMGGDTPYTGKVPDLNVDGFFTSWPENSAIILQRRKTMMPTLLFYEFGAGKVVASSTYSDASSAFWLSSQQDSYLIRDIIGWAFDQDMVEYSLNTEVEVEKTVVNPVISSESWSSFTRGDLASISVDVTNNGDQDVDLISFLLISPSYKFTTVNVSETLIVDESKLIKLEYQTSQDSETGVWMVVYNLYSSGVKVDSLYTQSFTLDIDLDMLSSYTTTYEIKDPFGRIITNGENSYHLPPGDDVTIKVPLLPEQSGVWTLAHRTIDGYNHIIEEGIDRFSVSDNKQNPGGYSAAQSDMTFTVTSYSENYPTDSNATFNVHVWNWGETDVEVFATWGFPHHLMGNNYPEAIGDPAIIGSSGRRIFAHPLYGQMPWSLIPHYDNVYNSTFMVPAGGEYHFEFKTTILSESWLSFDRFRVVFYDNTVLQESLVQPTTGKIWASFLGTASRGFYVYPRYSDPRSVLLNNIQTPKTEYWLGEDTEYTIEFVNPNELNFIGTYNVKLLDPDDDVLFEWDGDIDAPAYQSSFETILLQIPDEFPKYREWLASGNKLPLRLVASTETWLDRTVAVGESSFFVKSMVSSEMRYRQDVSVRQDLGFNVTITNNRPVDLVTDVTLSIPDLGYENIWAVNLPVTESAMYSHDIIIPSNLESGLHDIYFTLDSEQTTIKETFNVPDSSIVLKPRLEGSDLSIKAENRGGIDVDYIATVHLLDARSTTLVDDKFTGSLTPEEVEDWGYTFSSDLLNGYYVLNVTIYDEPLDRKSFFLYKIDVDGLAVNMESETDMKVYSDVEDISVMTEIGNLDGPIEDAQLNLEILGQRPCVLPYDGMQITEDTLLCPGTYTIKDEDSQGVINIGADNVILDCNCAVLDGVDGGSYSSLMGFGIRVSGDGVTVKDCTLRNYQFGIVTNGDSVIITGNKLDEIEERGIWLNYGASNNYVINNELSNCDYAGIISYSSTGGNVIAENTIEDGEYGIYLKSGENNLVYDNDVFDNKYGLHSEAQSNRIIGNNFTWTSTSYGDWGVVFEDSHENLFADNHVQGPYNGIRLDDSNNNVLSRNNITYSVYNGVLLEGGSGDNNITGNNISKHSRRGVFIDGYGSNNIIYNNTISENGYDGITLEYYCSGTCVSYLENTTIALNNITGNTDNGIYIEGFVYETEIVNNTITYNEYGIYSWYSGSTLIIPVNTTVYHNYIADNTVRQASDYSVENHYNTTGEGNYWSDYSGADDNGDGIGDTPYQVHYPTRGYDYYPIMEPYDWQPFSLTFPQNDLTPPSIPPVPGLAPQPGSGGNIWNRVLVFDIAETESVQSDVGTLGVLGKQYLQSILQTSSGQILSQKLSTFYIVDGDIYLVVETDKDAYKPGESISVYYEVGNLGTQNEFITLNLLKDDVSFSQESFDLEAGHVYTGSTVTTSSASFELKATAGGLTVAEEVAVISPDVEIDVVAPTVAGVEPFNVSVQIRNNAEITTDLNIDIDGSQQSISLLPLGTSLTQQEITIEQDETVTVTISGDITDIITVPVTFGEEYVIDIHPHNLYKTGLIEIPYWVNNTGILDANFNLTFSLDGYAVTRRISLNPDNNLRDILRINLSKGGHVLHYDSPLMQGDIPVNVDNPAKFVVTEAPSDQTVNINDNAKLTISVKNIGGFRGNANATLTVPGIGNIWNMTWVDPGEEKPLCFTLKVPDDVEEKTYAAKLEFQSETYPFDLTVNGIKIAVEASTDKNWYASEENVVLSLEVENLRDMSLALLASANLASNYQSTRFELEPFETKIIELTVPVNFTEKLGYGVYTGSGRSLYLNSMYIMDETMPPEGIMVYTDKQSYLMQEHVTVYVTLTTPGQLYMKAPGFEETQTMDAGDYTFGFDLPKLRTGVYGVEYTFNDASFWRPFDVHGYEAISLNAALDKVQYETGETVSLTLVVESNKDFDGLVKLWVYDPACNIIGEAETDFTFTEGLNSVNIITTLQTAADGVHGFAYRVYAYGSLILLSSGGGYFDVADTFPPEIDVKSPTPSRYTDTSIPLIYSVNEPTQWVSYSLDGAANVTLTGNTALTGLSKSGHTITLYAEDLKNNQGKATVSFSVVSPDRTPSPTVAPLEAVQLMEATDVTADAMTLRWTRCTSQHFTAYTLHMSQSSGELGGPITTIKDIDETSHRVDGLDLDTAYYFTVRVSDDLGRHADSNQVLATTDTESEPPVITVHSPVNITVTVDEYIIDWTTDEALEYIVMSLDGGANVTLTPGHRLTGLGPGEHTLIIYACDIYGNTVTKTLAVMAESPSSDSVPPSIVHFPVEKALGSGALTIYAAISDDSVVQYARLFYRPGGTDAFSWVEMEKCSSCFDSYDGEIPAQVMSHETVEYYIAAGDESNDAYHPAEAPQRLHVIAVDLPPAAITLQPPSEVGFNHVNLTWTPCVEDDFHNYTLYVSQSGFTVGDPTVILTEQSEASAQVTDLSQETTYFFTLRVYDAAGLYADSPALEVTTGSPSVVSPLAIGVAAAVLLSVGYLIVSRGIDLGELAKRLPGKTQTR